VEPCDDDFAIDQKDLIYKDHLVYGKAVSRISVDKTILRILKVKLNKNRPFGQSLLDLLYRVSVFSDFAPRDDEDVRVFLWGSRLLALACWLAPAGLETP
jgi:hypothetical protein